MKSEPDLEHDASSDQPAQSGRVRQWIAATELKAIDAVSANLQRLRNTIEGPADGEGGDVRHGHKHAPAEDDTVAAEAKVLAKPRGRLFYYLVFVLMLAVGAVSGAAFSYHLLSKTITSNGMLVERLRDEVAALEKQDAIARKQQVRDQLMVREYNRSNQQLQDEIADYKTQVEDLRTKLDAARRSSQASTQPATPVAGQSSRGAFAATSSARRTTPQKAGTCAMDANNVTASLEKCVDKFNR